MKKMKVAKIISTKQIVVNAGKSDGLAEGDELEIIGEIGDPVKDPDTGKVIGTLDNLKGRVIVTTVYQNMSIADAPKKEVLNDPYSRILRQSHLFSKQIDPMKQWKGTVQEDLDVDPDEITGGLPESKNEYEDMIHVGDTVILVSDAN
ncbi:hypothetical protein [Limosilactobacillus antri]|nr:hypothetical protein [Limosilactobacillus antri]